MKAENIHILEEAKLPGGACDGIEDAQKGFIIRGGREMENHKASMEKIIYDKRRRFI